MSDFNSSLPVRTETNGDVAVKIVDGTVVSQALSIDSSGKIIAKLNDGAGNSLTSQVNGSQQALDVGINVSGAQIDPRSIRALTSSDIVTVVQPSGSSLHVNVDNFPATVAVTQSTSPWVVSGTVTSNQGTSPWITKDQSDGPVTPGTVASFSSLIGGQYNSSLPTLTTGQQSAIQVDSSGRLLVSFTSTDDHNYGTVGASTLRTAAQIGNATGAADFNFGTIGAQSLRVASQLGNATGAASFGAGATSAQTLRVSANISDSSGTAFSNSNPLPVTIEDSPGTPVNDYKDASSIGAGATDSHDYTVTAGKTLHLNQIESSASGKAKIDIKVETGVATGVFTTRFSQFNSTSNPDMSVILKNPISVAAGVRVRCTMTNKDNQSQDLYSTICGYEI